MKFYAICILLILQLFCYRGAAADELEHNENSASVNNAERPWLRINDKKTAAERRPYLHSFWGARRELPFAANGFWGAREATEGNMNERPYFGKYWARREANALPFAANGFWGARETEGTKELPYGFWGARATQEEARELPFAANGFWGARETEGAKKLPYGFWGAREAGKAKELPFAANGFWGAREATTKESSTLPWIQRLRSTNNENTETAKNGENELVGEKRAIPAYFGFKKESNTMKLLKNLAKKEKIPYYDFKRSLLSAGASTSEKAVLQRSAKDTENKEEKQ